MDPVQYYRTEYWAVRKIIDPAVRDDVARWVNGGYLFVGESAIHGEPNAPGTTFIWTSFPLRISVVRPDVFTDTNWLQLGVTRYVVVHEYFEWTGMGHEDACAYTNRATGLTGTWGSLTSSCSK